MQIYHNPRCAKSRAGLAYLEQKGYSFEVVKYLEKELTHEELKGIIDKFGKRPVDLIRTQEKIFIEKYKGKSFSDDEWINIIIENPKLLQRPIVIEGEKAILAQPPEEIEKII